MTTAEMLTKVRTLLDEASAGLWSDTEIYYALSDGQMEVINTLIKISEAKGEMPKALIPLFATDTGTGTSSLASDFLYPLSMVATGDSTPIFIRDFEKNRDHLIENTYLASSSTQPYAYFQGTQVVLETSVAWALDYIKEPSDIASGVNPTIGESAHNAVVQYAFAYLLTKDEDPRANTEFQKYVNLLQSIT